MKRPTRRGLTRLALVVAAPVLAGCGMSSSGTARPYDPSDGVSSRVGTVDVRNLLVVSSATGAPGVVSGALLNEATDAVTVTVGLQGQTGTSVEVPAQGSVLLGSQTGEPSASPGLRESDAAVIQLASMPEPPGATVTMTLSTPDGGAVTVLVPVLANTLEYASITPTGGSVETSTTSPTSEPTTESSDEPSPAVTGTPGETTEPPTSTTTRPATPTSAPEGTASADPNVSATQ